MFTLGKNACYCSILSFVVVLIAGTEPVHAVAKRRPIVAAVDTRRTRGVSGKGSGIFTYSASGDRLKRLTHGLTRSPLWSPDGTRIMFTTGYENKEEIWIVRADGTQRRQVTHNRQWDAWPTWAPGGIRFVEQRADVQRGFGSLYVVNRKTHHQTDLTPRGVTGGCPDWASDGTRIAFEGSEPGIYSIRPNGHHLKQLTALNDLAPQWSPDSSRIIFARSTSGTPSYSQLFVMKRNGMHQRPLTPDDANAYRYSWSPDGKWVVVSLNKSDSSSALVVMRRDGSHSREIVTSDPDSDYEDFISPTWSHNGKQIAYQRYVSRGNYVRTSLWVVHSNGTHNHIFKDSTPKADELTPNWASVGEDCAIDSY